MKKRTKGIILCIVLAIFAVSLFLCITYIEEKYPSKIYTEDHPAYIGRLTIPAVEIDVACYAFEPSGEEEAKEMYSAMDEEDCAVKFWFGTNKAWCEVIADHNTEGFKTLVKCQPGDMAYITSDNGTVDEYLVTECFTGHNVEGDGISVASDLTDDEYNSVVGMNSGGIILYTCLDSWENVQIVFLQPKE